MGGQIPLLIARVPVKFVSESRPRAPELTCKNPRSHSRISSIVKHSDKASGGLGFGTGGVPRGSTFRICSKEEDW